VNFSEKIETVLNKGKKVCVLSLLFTEKSILRKLRHQKENSVPNPEATGKTQSLFLKSKPKRE